MFSAFIKLKLFRQVSAGEISKEHHEWIFVAPTVSVLLQILLDQESLVNPVMRTSKGGLMTPLDAALYKGNRGCAKYMQLHGGVPANKLTSQSAALRGSAHRSAGQVLAGKYKLWQPARRYGIKATNVL